MSDVRPREVSRAELRSRIVEAAARLLDDGGEDAVTTRAVAEHAAVQAPTIYRLFGDKDGLLEAVVEYELARFAAAKAAADATSGASSDPVAGLRASWDQHLAFGLGHPALFRLMSHPERAARSPGVAAGHEVLRAKVHRLATAGRLRVAEPLAFDLIQAAGVGAILTLLARPPAEQDPALGRLLFEALAAAVLTDAPPAGQDPTTAAAVTLRAAGADLPGLTPGESALLGEWLDRIGTA